MPSIQIKRGTRAQINTAGGSNQLKAGELYLITDELLLAVGINAATYFSTNVLGNNPISGVKTFSFNSQAVLSTTTGSINIDWTAAQNYKQNEPTGTITYTFTAPPGPCHLQLLIDSDGTSTAQTINWPTMTWLGTTWAGANNKKAIINIWYDGTNYFAVGLNQV